MKTLSMVFLFGLLAACNRPQEGTLRCGGDRPGFTAVTAGFENGFFVAMSKQAVKLKPDVKAEVAQKGGEATLTVIAKDNTKADFTCSCGAGCSGSCSLVLSTDPTVPAVCTGDCSAPSACCGSCQLWKN